MGMLEKDAIKNWMDNSKKLELILKETERLHVSALDGEIKANKRVSKLEDAMLEIIALVDGETEAGFIARKVMFMK